MEKEKIYLISDASRKIEVESHVLRYWEDELKLPVKRNELGHRYYTEEDIREFQEIKKLKEKGLQLKAIRMILKDGRLTRLQSKEPISENGLHQIEKVFLTNLQSDERNPGKKIVSVQEEELRARIALKQEEDKKKEALEILPVQKRDIVADDEANDKMERLEYLMKRLIFEAVQESNEKFYEDVTETLTKELDYQFRMQEEREEQRENRKLLLEEEHYKQLDALLRGKSTERKEAKKEQRKLFKKKNKD